MGTGLKGVPFDVQLPQLAPVKGFNDYAVEAARQMIDVSLIDRGENIRRTVNAAFQARLNGSVGAIGILVELVVVAKPDGRVELIAGNGRLTAAEACGLREVPCRVFPLETPQAVLDSAKLHTNLFQAAINRMDVALALYAAMKADKLTQAQVAERFCLSQPRVCEYLRMLLHLSEADKRAFAEGRLSMKEALKRISKKRQQGCKDGPSVKPHNYRFDEFVFRLDAGIAHLDCETSLLVLVASSSGGIPSTKDAVKALTAAVKALKAKVESRAKNESTSTSPVCLPTNSQ